MTSILTLAAHGVMSGVLTVGDVGFLFTLFLINANSLFNLGNVYNTFIETTFEMKDMIKILSYKPRIQESPDAIEYVKKPGSGKIEFQNISLSYAGNQIFDNFSFVINPTDVVLITGASGVGKSTLFNMIFRLIDPESGRVLLDGQELKDFKIDSLRKEISYCSQTPIMFNNTV